MITGEQPEIFLTTDENGNLKMTDDQAALLGLLTQGKPNWKLVRERDNLINHSVDIKWIEWDEDGCYKADHQEPAIGRSLLMGPFNQFFNWQTTDVTEIVEQREDYVKFKTKNSVYELFKLK